MLVVAKHLQQRLELRAQVVVHRRPGNHDHHVGGADALVTVRTGQRAVGQGFLQHGLGVVFQERQLARANRLQRLLRNIEGANLQSLAGEGHRQRQPHVAQPAHNAKVIVHRRSSPCFTATACRRQTLQETPGYR